MNSSKHESVKETLASFGGGTMMGATASIKQGDIVFQRYTLQKVLGVGGMGVVWLAHDTKLDQQVALKFVPESLQHDGDAIHDLKVQTKLGLQLSHGNIVRVNGFEDDEESLAAISMEFVDGSTLGAMRLDQPAQVFEADSLHVYLLHILNALEYAHEEAKVVHRDLKPANVMVNSENRVKVADFGIACSLRNSVSRVMPLPQKAGSGTLNYMSPQQLLGAPASVADDIYSLGATIYELLTGTPPFYSGDIAMQIREITPPAMMQRRADNGIQGDVIPPHWEDVIAACLAKEPAVRPASISEIRKGLQGLPFVRGLPSGQSGAGPKLVTTGAPMAPKAARLSAPIVAGSLAAMMSICGAVYFLSLPSAPAQTGKPKPRLSVARFLHQEASATSFEAGDTSPVSKKSKWNDLIKELRLADYQDEPKLRELLLRAEGRGEHWAKKEDEEKQQYQTHVQALKAAVEKAHTACEAKDMGAGAKAAIWSDILRKNVPVFIAADSGVEHKGLLEQARVEQSNWQAAAAKERPVTQPTVAQLLAQTRVASWSPENWKAFIKMLQGVLHEKGHPTGKMDGSWTQSTFDALVAWQTDAKLPVTGLLNGMMLEHLGLQTVQEPLTQRATPAVGSTGVTKSTPSPRPAAGSPSWNDVMKAKVLTTPMSGFPGPALPFR